jgi:dethiobiotin synthetase
VKIFVTGTDTGVGKTVFAAALAGALGATYWKPVQAGDLEESDSDRVRMLSGLPPSQVLPEAYRLRTACSPHLAAELDCLRIDPGKLALPGADPLVVEGAGGLLVPLTRDCLFADVISEWDVPVVLVARTGLGTINHSLLSLHALRARKIPVLGIAFVGEPVPDSEAIVCTLGATKRLGRLPMVAPLERDRLQTAFSANFNLDDFR